MRSRANPVVAAMLGRDVLRTQSCERPLKRIVTGLQTLDDALGGGLPLGAMTEISGRGSAGRVTLALGVLAEHSVGNRVAWIDGADGFDVASAEASGVVLSNFLWVRSHEGRKLKRSLAAADILLDSGDFTVIVLDIVAGTRRWQGSRPAWWVRLGRKVAKAEAALLVLAEQGEVFGPSLRLACQLKACSGVEQLEVDFRWRRGACGSVEEPLIVLPPVR